MDKYFDKIVAHLDKKKAILTQPQDPDATDWKVSKPIVSISEDGFHLFCYYGKHYLHVYYDDEKVFNPYKIDIESQCIFSTQDVGVRFYEDIAPTEEDVVECIRYRLRK